MRQGMLPQPSRDHSTGSLDLSAQWVAAMRAGDWDAAWRINDRVLAARDVATRDDPTLPYHLRWVWDGTPPAGRSTLVRCYHGLGDTLLFARYLPLLREQGAARVTVEAQPELAPVLRTLPGVDEVVPFQLAAPLPPAPCTLEIMEIAHVLRVPPPAPPYLAAPGAPPEMPPLRVGLCWQAGQWDPARSLPLALLAPLARLPGVALVSLQRGPAAEAALAPDAPPFLNPRDRSLDMLATATLIAGLHLVVTVDTMVAHLAGALGRPAWVLLQRDPDWRWPHGPDASPWYPTLRLARQHEEGDWTGPVLTVTEAVAERAAGLARLQQGCLGL